MASRLLFLPNYSSCVIFFDQKQMVLNVMQDSSGCVPYIFLVIHTCPGPFVYSVCRPYKLFSSTVNGTKFLWFQITDFFRNVVFEHETPGNQKFYTAPNVKLVFVRTKEIETGSNEVGKIHRVTSVPFILIFMLD